MQTLLFFLPGSLLFLSPYFEKKKASETLIFSMLFSVSFYIIISALSMIVHAPMTLMVYASILLSFIIMVVKRREFGKIVSRKYDRLVVLTLFIVLILRLLPMLFLIVPSDPSLSTMAYSASSIYGSDTVLWNINVLSGFPSLAAALSIVGGSQVYRSVLLLSCISYFMFSSALYLFLIKFFEGRIALISSIAASSMLFGPATDILSFSLFLASVPLFWEQRKTHDPVILTLAFMLVVSALLTSLSFNLVYFLLFIAILAGLAFMSGPKMPSNLLLTAIALVCCAAYLVLYIYLPVSNRVMTRYDMAAMRWIDSTIGKNALFLVNDRDAGIWIPAITGRSALTAGIPSKKASYIYIGSRSSGNVSYRKDDLEGDPLHYKRVYTNMGGAQVWKVL